MAKEAFTNEIIAFVLCKGVALSEKHSKPQKFVKDCKMEFFTSSARASFPKTQIETTISFVPLHFASK